MIVNCPGTVKQIGNGDKLVDHSNVMPIAIRAMSGVRSGAELNEEKIDAGFLLYVKKGYLEAVEGCQCQSSQGTAGTASA